MQIFHPNTSVHGIPAENVFYVADSAGQAQGEGILIPGYHPDLFPDRPLSVFINIKATGSWRDILLGALLARTHQIEEAQPGMKSRVFTQVSPKDEPTLRYYAENGFTADDGVDIVQLELPNARAATPMGYQIGFTPTETPLNRQGLLGRMNHYRLTPWSMQHLQSFMNMPHYFTLNILQGDIIVGEATFIGQGNSARLVGLYILPAYRGKGLAQTLIACGMKQLAERGVTRIEGEVIRRSKGQVRLAMACNASFLHTAFYYPGYDDN